MEDKKIIELYHSRSENALVETEKSMEDSLHI